MLSIVGFILERYQLSLISNESSIIVTLTGFFLFFVTFLMPLSAIFIVHNNMTYEYGFLNRIFVTIRNPSSLLYILLSFLFFLSFVLMFFSQYQPYQEIEKILGSYINFYTELDDSSITIEQGFALFLDEPANYEQFMDISAIISSFGFWLVTFIFSFIAFFATLFPIYFYYVKVVSDVKFIKRIQTTFYDFIKNSLNLLLVFIILIVGFYVISYTSYINYFVNIVANFFIQAFLLIFIGQTFFGLLGQPISSEYDLELSDKL
jgi:hypothetical protein